MAKPGVSDKVRNALIGGNPHNVSNHQFDFAHEVGIDPRGRAGILLAVDAPNIIDHAQSFMG